MEFRPLDKTYRFTAGDDADTVVVGNAARGDRVDAHVACRRFGGEVEFSVGLAGRYESANIRDGDAALFRGAREEVRIFQRPADGQIEIETILLRRPRVSEWVYQIRGHENLDFFYQPELTGQDLLDAGTQRPDDVIGSYAAYHKTRSGHVLGRTNYRAGKAFHIYRPLAVDDRGQRQWGEVTINPAVGELRVWFDPFWLADARYPVVVDPNLGYTSVGASSWTMQSFNWWLVNYGGVTAGSDGVASKLWCAPDAAQKYKIACYDGTSSANRLSGSYEELSPTAGVFNPTDISGESLAITSGNPYHVAMCGDEVGAFCGLRYDAGTSGDSKYVYLAGYASAMSNPSASTNNAPYRMSLYLEYAAAGGATTVNLLSLAVDASLVAPAITIGTTLILSPVTQAATIVAPTVAVGTTLTVAPVTVTASLTSPVVSAGTTLVLSPVSIATTIIAPALSVGTELTIGPLGSAQASVVAPAITIGTELTLSPMTVAASIVPPAVGTATEVSLNPISIAASLQVPAVAVGTELTLPAIAAGQTIIPPTISIGTELSPAPLSVAASIPLPVVTANGPGGPSPYYYLLQGAA